MKNLVEAASETAFRAAARYQTHSSCRILLIDDNVSVRELSARVLARSGYQVDAAEDGEAGWRIIKSDSYDLLVTGNHMPRLSGFGLVQRLRFQRIRLPVIIASGHLDTEELNRDPWLDVAALLLKPFTTDQLLATVEEVLRPAGTIRVRTGVRFPLLAEAFSHIEPVLRWGINE